ncbi:hypothetical protein GCM10023169_24210 [Georgenia halophila]|uniref:Uncharacterized protein n=1 Tax=Georgenia halophila TaxID=620889 RepID=A0ABP8LBC2_9MICO
MTERGSETRANIQDRCRDAHLLHCHGTWIRHADGLEECTDLDCRTPAEGHEHRTDVGEQGRHRAG